MAAAATRRSSWIVVPFLLVVVLAAGWSAFWYYTASAADSAMAAWIEREAAVGRVYACRSRSIGGYPFRVEARCEEPSVELRRDGAPVVVRAKQILAVAQIYQPQLVIAEVTGPMTITDHAGGAPPLSADWTLLQVSFRGRPNTPERISIAVREPRLERSDTTPPAPVARAERLEFHARQQPSSAPNAPVFDLAANTSGAVISIVPALAARPLEAEAVAVLRGLDDFAPKPLAMRLRDWQAAGGRLEITNARARQGEAVAVAKGDIGLSTRGRLDGAVTLSVAGFDELLRLIGLPTVAEGGRAAGILAGLSILGGRAEIDGKRAMAIPLRFQDGAVYFGPIPLGRLGPMF